MWKPGQASVCLPSEAHSTPPTPKKHTFWHLSRPKLILWVFLSDTTTSNMNSWKSLYSSLHPKHFCGVWNDLGPKETKQKLSKTKTTSHIDGRMWMAGGKSTVVLFFSIRPHDKYKNNVAPTSVPLGNARDDTDDLPVLTTIWKLQATLKKTSFLERRNSGL